jgi:hypothetical protein
MLQLILGSFARQLGSVAAGYLAGHGVTVVGGDPTTTLLIAVGVYIAMQAWSLLHKAGKVKA